MEWAERIITGIVTVCAGGGLGAWVVKVMQARHLARMEREKAAHEQRLAEHQEAWQRLSEVVTRQDGQIKGLQAETQRSAVAEMACRDELSRTRAFGQWIYGIVRQLHVSLKAHGGNPDPLPEFEEFAKLPPSAWSDKEFEARTAEHKAQLLSEEAKVVQQKPPDGGAHDGAGGR